MFFSMPEKLEQQGEKIGGLNESVPAKEVQVTILALRLYSNIRDYDYHTTMLYYY